jgi:hypothetical protein
LAARGNRLVRVGRFGVAFVATAAVALGSTQPAFAEDAPPPPAADTTGSETTPAPTPQADTTAPQPATAEPQPAPDKPSAEPAPTAPAGGGTSESAPPAADTAEPKTAPAEAAPTATKPEPEPAPKDAVKLEEAPPQPAAPAATAPEPVSSAPPAPTIVLEGPAAAPAPPTTTAEPPTAATSAATNAEAAGPLIVSLRPRPTPAAIALLPANEPAFVEESQPPRPAGVAGKQFVKRTTCARPTARVPLSQRCKQARAVAVLRVTLINSSSPEAVRAAIARVVAAPVVGRRVDARTPTDSKPKKKHPVAEVRPTVPFGVSGQGATHDGFNGSSGSTWSSRMFALPAAPLRVPRPFRFARLRLPSTLPHGVIPAPPSARPG